MKTLLKTPFSSPAAQHNNPVSSLAGRSLVCGTPTYLYFHGVDYSRQQARRGPDVRRSLGNLDLFSSMGWIISISPPTSGPATTLDQQTLTSLFPLWYQDGFVTILEVAGQPEGQPSGPSPRPRLAPWMGLRPEQGVWSKASGGGRAQNP